MRDLLGNFDPLARLDAGLGLGGGRALAKFPELPPEEAEPLKDQFLRRTLSGLHYAGTSLDKAFGGRAIRGIASGLLGGDTSRALREAASIIPFSDTIGFTDPEQTVTGEDLLKQTGYDPSRGNWAERNLAGPALEIALDPGSYLSLGGKPAATALGKVMQAGGHVPGWGHKALIEGFEHTAPGLRAAGKTAEEIAHMGRQGARIASDDIVQAAIAKGFDPDLAGKPLAGLAGWGLPFRENAFTTGHGGISKAIAGGFDVLKEGAKYAPGVRALRALVDTRAGRVGHAGAQRAYETAAVPAREEIDAATRLMETNLRGQFDQIMQNVGDLPGVEHEAMRVIRGLAENVPQYRDPARHAADLARRAALGRTIGPLDVPRVTAAIGGQYPELQAIADVIRTHGEETYQRAAELGLPLSELGDDWIDYALRRYIGAGPQFSTKSTAPFLPTTSGSNIRRSKVLTNIPGGTEQLNEWASDPRLVGPRRIADADVVKQVEDDLIHTALLDHPTGVLTPAEQAAWRGKAGVIATWLKDVPAGHVTGAAPVPFFSPDVIGDALTRGRRAASTEGAGHALYSGIGQMARPLGDPSLGPDPVRIHQFLHDANMRTTADLPAHLAEADRAAITAAGFPGVDRAREVARLIQATPPGTAPAGVTAAEEAGYRALGPLGDQLTRELHAPSVHAYEALARQGLGDVMDVHRGLADPATAVGQYALPRADADALNQMLQGFVAPTEMRPVFGGLRGSQTLFKNMVYPIWPASHAKNMISILWNNLIQGGRLGDLLAGRGVGDIRDAVRIMRGKAIDPARYGGLAAPELERLGYAHGKIFGGVGGFNERIGAHGIEDPRLATALLGGRRLTPFAPGHTPHPSLGELLKQPGAWNPLHQEGVGGGLLHQAVNRVFRGGAEALPYAEDKFWPLRVGRGVGTKAEDLGRMSQFLGNVRRGYSPAEAGALVRKTHFDYSDLTPFEQNVMKNIVPFYTFARKNIPYQLGMMAERPSAVSPLLHAVGNASGRQWVPEYLASGAAVPMGQEQEGTQRYLTSLGLPIEEALARFKFRDVDMPGIGTRTLPSPGATLLSFLGSLNPLLKAVPEWATDTQFSTGRKLSDLSTAGPASLWGNLPDEYARPLAQILATSPLARFTTAGRTLTDPRKWESPEAMAALGTNLLTGVRLSDVDVAKQRAIAARNQLNQVLAADPHLAEFTNYYPKQNAGILSPELIQRLRLFTTMKNESKAYVERKRQEEAAAAAAAGR